MSVVALAIMVTDRRASSKITQYGATLSNDGTHIILPQGAQLFELGLEHRRLFEIYARDHGSEWLERFQDRLGPPRSHSLYLLTGLYKTCSWSIASFGMKGAASTDPVRIHCTLKEVDERVILVGSGASVWRPAGRFQRKIGPAPDRQGRNNQTVFIQGFIITPNLQQGQQQAGMFDIRAPRTQFLGSFIGSSAKTIVTKSTKSDIKVEHVPQISHVSSFPHLHPVV